MNNKINADILINNGYIQHEPKLDNQFISDKFIQITLRRLMNNKNYNEIYNDLKQFGERTVNELLPIAKHMDTPSEWPRLQQYDAWGHRVDDIITCNGWKHMKKVSAEEGLIACGYERKYGEDSRLYQFTKLYLFAPSAGLFTCPLAMTDGAARLIEVHKKNNKAPHFKDAPSTTPLYEAYPHLTSRDINKFWTSGQWMTERKGGSDVGDGTETVAKLNSDGTYSLYGYKWFTSATDSDMTITLARIVDKDGNVQAGSSGLSCFYLRVRNNDGKLNNIRVVRLKNKLGTKQVPTAELILDGSKAHLISTPGRGVGAIANLINITRLYNACSACSSMRRIIDLNRDYTKRRVVFGELLKDNALHLETLANMEIKTRACVLITFESIKLLGRIECYPNESDEALLRLLTPLTKLYTAKLAVNVVSEGIESFGGQGYIEDTGLPGILRDAQVLPIWEGTTNVLSMDCLRALQRSRGKALNVFKQRIYNILNKCIEQQQQQQQQQSHENEFKNECNIIKNALNIVEHMIKTYLKSFQSHLLNARARDLSFSLSKIFIATCFIDHWLYTNDNNDAWIAKQWINGQVHGIGELIEPTLNNDTIITSTNINERLQNVRLTALSSKL